MADEKRCVNCIHFEVCAYVDPMLPVCDSYAEPVKHGRWVDDPDIWRCDQCLEWLDILQGTADMNYCPHCGAKMDWGADHED